MKNNQKLKNMDVDLNTLQFFNTEEFNKFMNNLLNQDTLNFSTREDVLEKIQKTLEFYKSLKTFNESSDVATTKIAQINSLLSSNGFSTKEELEAFIDNELAEISNIINEKTEQMGLYIVDHSSCIADEITQRVEELSDSANDKLQKTEQELDMLQSALSDNTDYIESEIERKTEKLGNEIQNMTSTVSPSTQLAIIKPKFSDILKRVLSERNNAKRNYKFASKSLKGSYPAPKSIFRCFCEAYFEYADEKDIVKNRSTENIQNKIVQKSERKKEIKNFLSSLQNKGNVELEKARQESNVALELLPSLTQLVNTTANHDVATLENNINNIKNKHHASYSTLLNKLQLTSTAKQPLKLVVDNTVSAKKPIEEVKTEVITSVETIPETNVAPVANEFESTAPIAENTEVNNIVEFTAVPEANTASDSVSADEIEMAANKFLEDVSKFAEPIIPEVEPVKEVAAPKAIDTLDMPQLEMPTLDGLDTIPDMTTSSTIESTAEVKAESILINDEDISEMAELITTPSEITEASTITTATTNDTVVEITNEQPAITQTEKENIIEQVVKDEVEAIKHPNAKPTTQAVKPATTTSTAVPTKDELEKTRIKTQEKLQKAQDKFDKVIAKAQEQLELAKAKAELEINRMKNQAIEALKVANDTANKIINDANEKTLVLISNANVSADEVIKLANQTSKDMIAKADMEATRLVVDTKGQTQKMQLELDEKCKNILSEAEQKSNAIIIAANQQSEELLTSSQNKANEILNSIDTRIENRKNKIVELNQFINKSENNITTLKARIEDSKQKIISFEKLKATAQGLNLNDEVTDYDSKLDILSNAITKSKDTIVQLQDAIKTATNNISEIEKTLPTLRETLEKNANTLLENSKKAARELIDKSQAESKGIREKARLTVADLKEETHHEIEVMLTEARMKSQKIKEDAEIEASQIVEQSHKKAQLIKDSAQNQSEEIKANAQVEAQTLKETKKAELEFILTEEEIKEIC